MFSDFAKNEILMSCDYIMSHGLIEKEDAVINIIGEHPLCNYLKATFDALNSKTEYKYTVHQKKTSDAFISTVSKQCFLYMIDTRQGSFDTKKLSALLDKLAVISNAELICMVVTPATVSNVHSLSEMELSNVLCGTKLSEVEQVLSAYCNKVIIKEIRFDNFLCEDIKENPLNLSEIAKDAAKGTITINSDDAYKFATAVSYSDAVDAVFTVIKNGKHGNVYNCSGKMMSVFELKSFVHQTLSKYGVMLRLDGNNKAVTSYTALNCGKLQSLGFEYICDNNTRLLYALSDMCEYDIIADKTSSIYDGKLQHIREMELELLKTVDKICRDNKIMYFLSGGTMLGAIRHKGFIPWDDDIDIAMLREDFVKFKEIIKKQLPNKYKYQSFENKDGYHYFFDKITINDTYFSTKYSDDFEMQKGISMDIFVFDKTSDNKFMQKLHFKSLMMLRLLMNVRWKNTARKGKSYLLSKLMLPLLRLFSMDTYSKWYDKKLRKYEKNNTRTILPPATDHKWRGVMPLEWFSKVTDARFEDVESFVPVGYDNYLKQWYCENYMELLPLSQRVCSHDFYRLDIGNELNNDYTKHYNYKGELL